MTDAREDESTVDTMHERAFRVFMWDPQNNQDGQLAPQMMGLFEEAMDEFLTELFDQHRNGFETFEVYYDGRTSSRLGTVLAKYTDDEQSDWKIRTRKPHFHRYGKKALATYPYQMVRKLEPQAILVLRDGDQEHEGVAKFVNFALDYKFNADECFVLRILLPKQQSVSYLV